MNPNNPTQQSQSDNRPGPISLWEAADLAIRLAQLKNQAEPDLFGAMQLLIRIKEAFASGDLTMAAVESAETPEEYRELVDQLGTWGEGEPDDRELEADLARDFFGKKWDIQEPSLPIPLEEAIWIVSKEKNKNRRLRFYQSYQQAGNTSIPDPIPCRDTFWNFAQSFLKHCPRGQEKAPSKVVQKSPDLPQSGRAGENPERIAPALFRVKKRHGKGQRKKSNPKK